MIKPTYGDIDWDMAGMTLPPEAIYKDAFMKEGLWMEYNKQLGKKPDISFTESLDIAKTLWRQYCDYQETHERKEIEIEDQNVELCCVEHTDKEPVISMMVSLPGLGGTEIIVSRNEILHMLDALNGEW